MNPTTPSSDFSLIEPNEPNIPTASTAAPNNGLDLISPNSILTGTSAGIQYLGGPNIFSDSNNGYIGVQQNGTPQVLMGKHPKLGEGFYVSKLGVNVVSNSDPNQFIFNSSQDTFKILQSNSVTLPYGISPFISNQYSSGSTSTTIPHNLGFLPAFLAYVSNGGTAYSQMPFNAATGTGTSANWYNVNASIDSSNLYIDQSSLSFNEGTSFGGLVIKYYLLQETAN